MAGGNGNNLVAFNVRNNNAFPITFTGIASNAFASGAVVSRVFYKTTPIAGAPGAIDPTNGWNQFGTANNNVVTDEKSSEFLKKATNSGMAEVQLAKLAQQKATIEAVKNFAAMLERDHTAANQQVKSMADQRHVDVPSTISDDKQKMYNDMQKKTGKTFDKDYISMMVKSHNDGISLFENTRSNASDIDVKNFADKTLPTLKMHLDSAKAIQKRYW
jgi:putative membrane protein